MRGYFSRIARQCGLRYPGRETEPRSLPFVKPAGNSTPLDREETVMVPPPLPDIQAEGAIASDGGRKSHNAAERRPAHNSKLNEKPHDPGEVSVQVPAHHRETPLLKKRPTVSAPGENTENRSPEMKEPRIKQDGVSSRLSDSAQPAGKESERRSGTGEQRRHSTVAERAGYEEVKPPQGAPASEAGKKGYFARTVPIIDKGEPGTPDVQKIVFHDVLEWVAASPFDAGTQQPHCENITAVLLSDAAQSRVPGDVKVRENAQNKRPEQAGLKERNFDLSIGTISVVIEEPPRPHQPEPPVHHNGTAAARASEPRYSRLNRSYL